MLFRDSARASSNVRVQTSAKESNTDLEVNRPPNSRVPENLRFSAPRLPLYAVTDFPARRPGFASRKSNPENPLRKRLVGSPTFPGKVAGGKIARATGGGRAGLATDRSHRDYGRDRHSDLLMVATAVQPVATGCPYHAEAIRELRLMVALPRLACVVGQALPAIWTRQCVMVTHGPARLRHPFTIARPKVGDSSVRHDAVDRVAAKKYEPQNVACSRAKDRHLAGQRRDRGE
jgi:hypothetical protein